jgi:hypothetical protein
MALDEDPLNEFVGPFTGDLCAVFHNQEPAA